MDKDNLSLTIAIVSLVISVYIFISQRYRELYRLGLSNSQAIFDTEEKVMYVELTFVNESSLPLTIENLTATLEESQSYSSNVGELINEKRNVIDRDHRFFRKMDAETKTLPITLEPYSTTSYYFAFSEFLVYGHDYFLEVETPNRFIVFTFNPNKKNYSIGIEKKGRSRLLVVTWRQHKLREAVRFFSRHFEKRTWQIYKIHTNTRFNNLKLKVKQSIQKRK